MEDTQIVRLYWERNQQAITESHRKYGGYCFSVANQLLNDRQDAEECVNDTFWGAWNAIPPHRPQQLKLFLAKITRRLAFNRYANRTAQKRGGGELPLVLEELGECIGRGSDPAEEAEGALLAESIRQFVSGLTARERGVFVDRYFFTYSIQQVAERNGLTANHTYVLLSRIREKLREYLGREGFYHE